MARISLFLILVVMGLILSGPDKVQADSIYPLGDDGSQVVDLFRKVYRPGDIVLIQVQERFNADQDVNVNVSSKSENNPDLSRQGNLLNRLFKPLFDAIGLGNFELTLDKSIQGGGRTGRASVVQFKVSAIVVEVLPNGNLLLEARKQVEVNREEMYAVIQAIARPEDIGADNTISSDRLAEVNLELIGEGDLSKRTKPGFLSRLFDRIF